MGDGQWVCRRRKLAFALHTCAVLKCNMHTVAKAKRAHHTQSLSNFPLLANDAQFHRSFRPIPPYVLFVYHNSNMFNTTPESPHNYPLTPIERRKFNSKSPLLFNRPFDLTPTRRRPAQNQTSHTTHSHIYTHWPPTYTTFRVRIFVRALLIHRQWPTIDTPNSRETAGGYVGSARLLLFQTCDI